MAAVGQNVLLSGNQLLGGLHATGAVAITLTNVFSVREILVAQTISTEAHGRRTAGNHEVDDQLGPLRNKMAALGE